MKKSMTHWYPRYPADYGKKTRHLSMMEHGAYALMMDYCYSTGNPIPANAEQVHRICMAFAPAEQEACMSVLQQFFVLGEDGWSNERITEELQKRNEISDKRANAARSMHEKKAASAGANAHPNADTSTSTATSTVVKKERAKALLSSDDDAKAAYDAYNEMAERAGLPEAQKYTPARQSSLKKRLKEVGGLDGWVFALEKVEQSDFLTGKRPTNNGPFHADLDFILQQSSFTRLMEGFYDNRSASNQHSARNTGASRAVSNLRAGFQASAADDRSGDGAGPADYQLPF